MPDLTADERLAAVAAVAQALREDLGEPATDLTSGPLSDLRVQADLIARAPGTVAGLDLAAAVFEQVAALLHSEASIAFDVRVNDGAQVEAGALLAVVAGPAHLVLSAERVALNFLQRLSGIATATAAYVAAIDGLECGIYDTRKTTPGLRHLERYAVRCGGGNNHRFGLFDAAMVKDNHVAAAGGVHEAVALVRANHPGCRLILEVQTLAELEQGLAVQPDVILLDNMSLKTMTEAVRFTAGRTPLEASGGVVLDTVRAVAATGVDRISIGALTHSAPALDIALDVGVQPQS